MRVRKTLFRLGLLVLFLLLATVCSVLFEKEKNEVRIGYVGKVFHNKEVKTKKNLKYLKEQIVATQNNNLNLADINNKNSDDIYYYILDNDSLIYWSDAGLDIFSLDFSKLTSDTLVTLSNAFCVLKTDSVGSYKLLGLIKIKDKFTYKDKLIENSFANGFDIDTKIVVQTYNRSNKNSVFSAEGKYLFSLTAETECVSYGFMYFLPLLFMLLAFVVYCTIFYNINELYPDKKLKFKHFTVWSILFAAIPVLLCLLKFPPYAFGIMFFNPVLYSGIFSSLGFFAVIIVLFGVVAFTFYRKIEINFDRHTKIYFVLISVILLLLYIFIVVIIRDIIDNSTLSPFVFSFFYNRASYSMIALFLVVVFIMSLWFIYEKIFEKLIAKISKVYLILAILALTIILLVILYTFDFLKQPTIATGGCMFLIFMLISAKIKFNRSNILDLLVFAYFISFFIMLYSNELIEKNQYEKAKALVNNLYIEQIDTNAVFAANFPDNYRLMENEIIRNLNGSTLQDYSCAIYLNNILTYKTGEYSYEKKRRDIMPKNDIQYEYDHVHYLFNLDDNHLIIVSYRQLTPIKANILNFTYIFMAFVVLILCTFVPFNIHRKHRRSITYSLQSAFSIVTVVSIVIVSVALIAFSYMEYSHYHQRFILSKIEHISHDIEHAISQNGTDENCLDSVVNTASDEFEAILHIYDKRGYLLATSSPNLFSSGLLSKLINSNYYFDPQNKNNTAVVTENIKKLTYMAGYRPIFDNNKIIGYVKMPILQSVLGIDYDILIYVSLAINLFLIMFIILSITNIFLNYRLNKPIKELNANLSKLSMIPNENKKIVVNDDDMAVEIVELVNQYNNMIDELSKKTEQLAQSEREGAWREMANQIAHEIKNPLTPMKLSVQHLQRLSKNNSEQFKPYFEMVSKSLIEQINNLASVANSFSNFAKLEQKPFRIVDIIKKLSSSIEVFRNNTNNVDIECFINKKQIFVKTDAEQIIQVFNNILKNALQAISQKVKGKIIVKVEEGVNMVTISFSDNGKGIDADILPNIFQPNFSTKVNNDGLGLSIAKTIVELSNGRIWVESQTNQGATFFVELPSIATENG
ncbi:MAG: HAMP domain-containing histidine kinase [Prevotellaceae bacterium]|jgi:signal transduction histidine kinase|nr:HAMP domain-containing histidine kinase [Prevotellaceae bacterium]